MAFIRNIYFKDENADWIIKQPKGTFNGLINGLLNEHIRQTELDDLSIEELEKLRKKALIMKEAEDKIKEVDNGN